ncbi:MAG: hypothetical protein H7257_07755, partial [Taibaiella sp.]|nr:hypothetical protein [Taibaiella sp.]
MASSVKQGIFYFLFAVLLLPLLQLYLPFVKSAPLSGIGSAPDVNFSFADWWEGTYQQKKSKYFDDNVGFRADFVRVNSQLNYSVFNYIHAGHIIEGEQNYLYMSDYIDSYYGRDFIGADSIRRQMVKLKAVQDTLQKLRKTLVLAYAPSKEFMYPEYIPAKLRGKRTTTNFETYLHTGTSVGINQLDLNTWYCG